MNSVAVTLDGKSCVVAGRSEGPTSFGGVEPTPVPDNAWGYVARLSRKTGAVQSVETVVSSIGDLEPLDMVSKNGVVWVTVRAFLPQCGCLCYAHGWALPASRLWSDSVRLSFVQHHPCCYLSTGYVRYGRSASRHAAHDQRLRSGEEGQAGGWRRGYRAARRTGL